MFILFEMKIFDQTTKRTQKSKKNDKYKKIIQNECLFQQ